MQLTAPVTDYIRASMLTTDGDMVVRRAGYPDRLGQNPTPTFLRCNSGASYPNWNVVRAVLGQYYKGGGSNTWPLFEALALSDTGIHIASNTRNAGGNQDIAGVGFEPSVVIFVACDNIAGNMNWSIGFSNVGSDQSIRAALAGTEMLWDSDYSIRIQRDGANEIYGQISTMLADGFRITWTLRAVCEVRFIYLCLP